jgi:hypothetical protein
MQVAIGVDMKMNRILMTMAMLMLILISCEDDEPCAPVPVNCAPDVPHGVYSVNYDGTVKICWVANYEADMDGYNVYRSETVDGKYSPIGTVYVTTANPAEYCYEDMDTGNGIHYFYAVSAFDKGKAESDLIVEEVVSGTPRPEGLDLSLQNAAALPNQSGFDFYPDLSNTAQLYTLESTDVFFEIVGGVPMFIVPVSHAGIEIQDYGYVSSFDAINVAPTAGWSASRTAEAIAGHMYILKLLEDDGYHYAKIYVTAVSVAGGSVTLDWAFQTDPGNPDLAPPAPGRGTGTLSSAQRSDLPGLNMEAKLTDRFSDPPIVERVTWTRDSGHQTTE